MRSSTKIYVVHDRELLFATIYRLRCTENASSLPESVVREIEKKAVFLALRVAQPAVRMLDELASVGLSTAARRSTTTTPFRFRWRSSLTSGRATQAS